MISEKNYQKIFNLFLLIIATMMIFRQLCTIIIILFAVFNLFFLEKLYFDKVSIWIGLIISSPFLLEIIFFWNNDFYLSGLKSLEKTITLLIFPLFILGNFKQILFIQLLRRYSILTTLIVFLFFIKFLIVYPELTNKYLNGIHLWEMGYVFTETIGIHAPALNMHLAFVGICNLYFFIKKENFEKYRLNKTMSLFLFLVSFFLVLLINTRVSLFCMLLGFGIIIYNEFVKDRFFKKKLFKIAMVSIFSIAILIIFIKNDSYIKEKYTTQIFSNIDKIGKLDEIEHPEIVVYSSLVTRLSIWKSTLELSLKNLPFGVGSSDGKIELIKYYKETNQKFLLKYEFPTHNQYLDCFLRFGFLGLFVILIYISTIGYIGIKLKNSIVIFFCFLFFISNITDDFLIRFDGIAFSGFWFSAFGVFFLQKTQITN